jgi:hypothetical protein
MRHDESCVHLLATCMLGRPLRNQSKVWMVLSLEEDHYLVNGKGILVSLAPGVLSSWSVHDRSFLMALTRMSLI